MALPTTADIVKLDYSFLGQPFCNLPAKSGLNMTSLDYSFLGQPFYTNPDGSLPSINTIGGTAIASINTIGGTATGSINSLGGVT